MKDDLNLYTDIKKLVYGRNRQVSLKQYSQFHEDMYLILLGLYDRSDISKDPSYTRSWIATEVIQFLIPNLEWLLDQGLSENDMQLAYKLWEKCMALASRKSFHHFLLYMELDRKADKQVYSNRQDVLGGIVFYLNKMQNEPDFMDLVGSFPPSFGKCNCPNTKVLTPKGNIKIKDLNVGDEVYSMQDREMVTEKVTNKWNTRKTQVKITTRSGKEIITSPEHKMFTDKGYKESKDLTVDDYFYRLNTRLEPKDNYEISDNELIFLGGMMFDGHCKKKRLGFAGEMNEFTERFIKACEELGFNITLVPKKGTESFNIRINNNEDETFNGGYDLLKKYNLHDKLSKEKRLPNQFFSLSMKDKMFFFGLMFATDGYLSEADTGITSASEGLIDDIQTLLQTVGVYSSKSYKLSKAKGKSYDAWRLSIPNEIARDFLDELYIYHKEPYKELINFTKTRKVGNMAVRYPHSLLADLEPRSKMVRNGVRCYDSKLRFERTYDRSPEMMEDYFDVYPELEEHRYKDFIYEPIVKIEYVDEEVDMVDIEVSNTHNFIANGYVSHNSFVVNYFSAWELGRNEDGSILRLSYSDDLLNGFSRSIKSLIMEDRFKEIFPRFEKYGNKPFSKDKSSDWLLKGSDSLASHYTRTRDGAVTGVRAKSYIILDDMTKGADEANNETVHQKYWDQYTTEWRNRKENDLVKEVVIGTMWNPKDILGRKGEQLKNQFEERDSRFPYIKEYINGKGNVCGVVIRVPLLDENLKSTCEDIYTTQTALNIKEDTDEFLFSCVYQQNPISPTGRLFAYDNLMQYEFEGNYLYHNGRRIELSKYSYASLDPVRKGIDFVAMPIFKYDVDNPHIYYLVDTLFQGKSMDEVYSEITSRVLQHDITRLVIENNTDTSLAHLVDKNLKNAGYYYCDVTEKFQTTKKEQRIRDENLPIRKQIVFPKQGMFPQNSEMGRFMSNITSFSVEQPNKHDDAPDSVALFVSEIVKDGYRGAKVEATRRPLGL